MVELALSGAARPIAGRITSWQHGGIASNHSKSPESDDLRPVGAHIGGQPSTLRIQGVGKPRPAATNEVNHMLKHRSRQKIPQPADQNRTGLQQSLDKPLKTQSWQSNGCIQ